jgi:hypothetical protein
MKTHTTYTLKQLTEYIRGYSRSCSDIQALTLDEIYSMLANATSQFKCDQYGFETVVKVAEEKKLEQQKQLNEAWRFCNKK